MPGRKQKPVHITAEGRDKGKTFIIKEMSASDAEWWAVRAFKGVVAAGINVPDNIRGSGMAGIAVMGLKAFADLHPRDLKDLMDEMFDCVFIQRDNNPNLIQKPLEEDIEEVSTRLRLREEWFELHTGFSLADVSRSSTPETSAEQSSSTAPTSPPQSQQ